MAGRERDERSLYTALDIALLNPAERREGVRTYLNVSSLWDLFYYIKDHKLTPQEKASIVDYQLQVFIIELAQEKAQYSTVEGVVKKILDEIRSEPGYWLEFSEIFEEIKKQTAEKSYRKEVEQRAVQIHMLGSQQVPAQSSNGQFVHMVSIKTDKTELKNILPQEAIENYKKYLTKAEAVFCKTKLHSHFKLDQAFDALYSHLFPSDEVTRSQLNTITQTFLREKKKSQNVTSSENRFTRRMKKTVKAPEFESLKREFETGQEALGKRLRLDLSDFSVLDYRNHIFVNPKCAPYNKVRLNLLPLVKNYLVSKELPGPIPFSSNFNLYLENLLLFLNQSFGQMDVQDMKSKPPKGLAPSSVLRRNGLAGAAEIEKFESYCQQKGLKLESFLDKTDSIRLKELVFLRNAIAIGRRYIAQTIAGDEPRHRLSRTFNRSTLHLRKRLLLSGPEKYGILIKLENAVNLPKCLATDLAAFFISNFDSRTSAPVQESAFRYTKMTERRVEFLKANTHLHELFEKSLHSNTYCNQDEEEEAIESYKQYIEDPSTKQKLSYKFYENEFKWPEKYFRQFLESFNKHKLKQIINGKIASEIGDGVNPNQVKHIKNRYQKELKKRAKSHKRSTDAQIKHDLEHFDLKKLFPWLTDKNIEREDRATKKD